MKPAFDGLELNSAPYIHLIAQIEDRVFADRQQYLGDPDSAKVPVDKLIDDAYLARRADEVKPDEVPGATPVKPGLDDGAQEKAQTTHFSVVDKWGNAVSNTYTLNGDFGSGVAVDGGGFLLNDAMDDFVTNPAGEAASGAAQRRGEHHRAGTSAAFVDDADDAAQGQQGVAGDRHARRLAHSDVDLPGDDQSLRLQHDRLPMRSRRCVFIINCCRRRRSTSSRIVRFTDELAAQLKALGYTLETQSFNGDVQMIRIDGTTPEPAADPRGVGVGRVIGVERRLGAAQVADSGWGSRQDCALIRTRLDE